MDVNKLRSIVEEAIKTDSRLNIKELANEFNCSGETINRYLRLWKIKDNYDITTQLNKGFIKAFDSPSLERSYWLGYLTADGCINSTNGKPRLILECQLEDKEILEQFCDWTHISKSRINNTIHYNPNSISEAVRLDLYKTSFNTFPDKWIQEQKSFKDTYLPEDIDFYSYLHGLIDGDGGIYNNKGGFHIELLARKPLFDSIVNKLKKDLPFPEKIYISEHPRTTGLYQLTIGRGTAKLNINDNFKFLLNQFNKDTYYLKRKMKKLNIIAR